MLIIPFAICSLLLILILFSSCIFKFAFKKLKSFTGFGQGFFLFVVTSFINILLTGVVFFIIVISIDEEFEKIIENYRRNFDNLIDFFEYYRKKEKLILILFLIKFFLYDIASFIIIFKFVKRLAHQQYEYSVVFMFISGYILLYIFTYFLFVIISIFPNKFSKEINEDKIQKDILFFIASNVMEILGFLGTAIMIFLLLKRTNKSLAWIIFPTFFGPNISYVIGIIFEISDITFYVRIGFYFVSFVFGIICFCKYYKSYREIDLKAQGFIQPQTRIESLY